MKRPTPALFATVAGVGFAHGQNPLDWSASSWALGATGASAHNYLGGAGSAFAAIKTFICNSGGHITAWVSDLNVTVIPKPSAYAVLLGCGTLILLAVRFRLARRD